MYAQCLLTTLGETEVGRWAAILGAGVAVQRTSYDWSFTLPTDSPNVVCIGRVDRTMLPYLRGGGGRFALRPILDIVCSHLQHAHSVYNMCTVYTTYAQCVQAILEQKWVCAQCLHVCTVSTDYTRVNVYVHSVNCAQCPQTVRIVYMFVQSLQTTLG